MVILENLFVDGVLSALECDGKLRNLGMKRLVVKLSTLLSTRPAVSLTLQPLPKELYSHRLSVLLKVLCSYFRFKTNRVILVCEKFEECPKCISERMASEIIDGVHLMGLLFS
jgi:hypothetical protein